MSANPRWCLAALEDLPRLVELMAEFYRESHYALDTVRSKVAFEAILTDTSLGRVWVLEKDGMTVGYMVLTLGFSMEYGGRDAFLDDLFIQSPYRGTGLGKTAIKTFFDACKAMKVRAVHLEVEEVNTTAKALYAGYGFKGSHRQLMTRRLADPL